MTLYILQFLFYDGPNAANAFFRSEQDAQKVMDDYAVGKTFQFVDDFGNRFFALPGKAACVLTSTDKQAATNAAATKAAHESGMIYSGPLASVKPSTH